MYSSIFNEIENMLWMCQFTATKQVGLTVDILCLPASTRDTNIVNKQRRNYPNCVIWSRFLDVRFKDKFIL